jgi:hypothetical protein
LALIFTTPNLIPVPTIIAAAAGKDHREFIARVNSELKDISIAKMIIPSAGANRGRHRIDEYTKC